MAVQVNSQKKQDNSTRDLLTIGGAVIGGVYGGGAGGAVTGAGVGNMAGGLLTPDQSGPQQLSTGSDSPMQRRIDSDQRLQELSQAKVAIAQLPPAEQQQYAPAINQAYMLERQKRGMT